MSDPVESEIKVSKRAIVRITDLHHKLTQETQSLSTQHSRFVGAMMACDSGTQRTMMLEYRDQLHAVHSVLSRLCVVIDRIGLDADSAGQ